MSANRFDQAAATWDHEPRRIALMRAIGEAILRQANPTKAMRVLDYGCGTGLIGLYLLPHVRSVTGADNSTGMLQVLREKITAGGLKDMQAVFLDLQKEATPGDRYNIVVAGMALHHIADTDRVLRAFHQLLLPGGTLCLADLDSEPGTFHSADVAGSVYHLGFDRDELKRQLCEVGFLQPADSTVAKFEKPVEGGGRREFSIFLITARRP
ncbi:MAG TPA: class I SAM-dependent methyltransferase [Candidatus Anammoximicrobium sp.]|nr:class I SAM-dependent methyltransferase [Candidatus Anammoximicrobium sp.]